MLDCYRVAILQRPPTCAPDLLRILFPELETNVANGDRNPLRHLFTPNSFVPTEIFSQTGIWLLTAVSYFASSGSLSSHCRWRPEFAESALAKWANMQVCQSIPSMALLHHLMNIELHANLSLLQGFARARVSAATGETATYKSLSHKVHQWLTTVDYKISEWHAHQIVMKASATYLDDADVALPRTLKPEERRIAMPHTPYCIYFATLILWCKAINAESPFPTSWSHIQKGVSILSTLGIRVATILAQALEEVGYPDVRT